MAVTSLEVPLRADVVRWRPRRLPRWALPALVVLLLLGVLAGAGLRIANVYSFQPLGSGSGGVGPLPYGGPMETANDGLVDTQYVLVGPAGVTGTVQYPLGNNSDQPVRLLGLGSGASITSLNWATESDPSTPRTFPITLQPHESLTLLVTVTKPTFCGGGTFYSVIGLPIRYEAMGVTHTYVLALQTGEQNNQYLPIVLCVPEGRSVHGR